MCSPSLMTNLMVSDNTDRENIEGHRMRKKLGSRFKYLECTLKVRDKKILYLSIADWICVLLILFCLSTYNQRNIF